MKYEVGKKYKSATGEVVLVESLDSSKVCMKVIESFKGENVEDKNLYIDGPAENFQGFMVAAGMVEV